MGKCGDCKWFPACYDFDADEQALNEDHEICAAYAGILPMREIMGDPDVEHPKRYMHGNVECFDMLESTLSPREVIGFYKGCILKYVWREQDKGGYKDLQKAEAYARRLNRFCAKIGEPGGAPHDASRESAKDTD